MRRFLKRLHYALKYFRMGWLLWDKVHAERLRQERRARVEALIRSGFCHPITWDPNIDAQREAGTALLRQAFGDDDVLP